MSPCHALIADVAETMVHSRVYKLSTQMPRRWLGIGTIVGNLAELDVSLLYP